MARIDITYTIKYSKGGILQYADFRYSEGKLYQHSFHPSWCKSDEVPDISKLTCINEILEKIKEFSYANRAEIYFINHAPPFMLNRDKEKEFVKEAESRLELFYLRELTKYYKKFLKPLIIKNKWSLGKSGVGYMVLIKKYDVDKYDEAYEVPEWDNVRNCPELFEFEYLCQEMMVKLGLKERVSLRGEHGRSDISVSYYLFQYLDFLEKEKFFVNVW